MFTSLNLKREYVMTATAALCQELSQPIQQTLAAIETNGLIADCAEWFRQMFQLDDEYNSHPDALSDEQWKTYWDDFESQLRELIHPSRELIRIGQGLQAAGESVAALRDLETVGAEAEDILNFPQDYGGTAKYQALSDEAERQQATGQLEEGGWE